MSTSYSDKWVGWYEAIEDLIPTLPESEFAPWQLERLPDELKDLYLSKDKGDYSNGHAEKEDPAMTVTANDYGRRRAFVVTSNQQNSTIRQMSPKHQGQPIDTILATEYRRPSTVPKAFIAPGGNANSFSIREANEPARVVGDVDRVGNMARAFIVNGTPNDNGASVTACAETMPSFTMTASVEKRPLRAFVVNDSDSKNPIRQQEKPHATVMASGAENNKVYSNGRVVKMTVHALARFQSFPDGYQWPDSNSLATRIIGNAVPPLFAQRLVEWLI